MADNYSVIDIYDCTKPGDIYLVWSREQAEELQEMLNYDHQDDHIYFSVYGPVNGPEDLHGVLGSKFATNLRIELLRSLWESLERYGEGAYIKWNAKLEGISPLHKEKMRRDIKPLRKEKRRRYNL